LPKLSDTKATTSFVRPVFLTVALLVIGALASLAANPPVRLPRVSHPPSISDFEGMAPHGAALELAKVTEFIQQSPSDGQPATKRTDVYIGYDESNIYFVWLCFDDPRNVRAQLQRREATVPFNEDYVELMLDTFHDQRHAFVFDVNPMGEQADGLWLEGGNTADYSFDTVWNSTGKITPQGYIVYMAIPFRSMRFHPAPDQTWGITLMRYIARADENDFWPRVSSRISGQLNQEATIGGLERVTPSHNMQFNPYTSFRSFRSLDDRDPLQPRFSERTAQFKLGLDSKFVFHDSLVLDTTINPDFSQVESDEPQNTVNQRFEVFFPEKRPFFLENSNFFGDTNIGVYSLSQMLFTRRIADPSFGTRLTGKQGPWNLGFFVADDRSPGKAVPQSDPLSGSRAYFAVGRVSHDFGEQNSVGVIYTDREFHGSFNRVGGFDVNYRLSKNWTAWYRGVVSSTTDVFSKQYLFGQDHEAVINNIGRRLSYEGMYQDITPNFRTETGFVPRTDLRNFSQYFHFYWRPENKALVFHGLELNTKDYWDHRGIGLQQVYSGDWVFGFRRNIILAPIAAYETDTLRPVDFGGLPDNRKFVQNGYGVVFRGSPSRLFSWQTRVIRDGTVLVVVPNGRLPITGDELFIDQSVTLRPTKRLEIDNTYILDRVLNGSAHHAAFNNHIIRSKWNYQFTREFSLRFIGQYNGLLANPLYSSLQTTKNFNADVLFTYLLHPGTAIYAGYNSNLENVIPGLWVHVAGATECDPNGNGLVRNNRFINDGRILFVKISYLWRR
jgi:hypothetical protein